MLSVSAVHSAEAKLTGFIFWSAPSLGLLGLCTSFRYLQDSFPYSTEGVLSMFFKNYLN
jgi:hypothetical protein